MVQQRRRLPSMTSLQVLLAIAERGSTTAAAESLNLSQSAVSKQLRTLEDFLGEPVFTRTAHGMTTTSAGAIYLTHARSAIKAMEDAALQLARLKPDPHALRLHVLPIFGDRWLLPRFERFTTRFPDIDVQFTTFLSPNQAEEPDASFSYDTNPLAGHDGVYLFGRDARLIATSDYWAKIGSPTRLDDLTRGVMLEHPQTRLHWTDFATANGRPDLQPRHTVHFGYYTMVIRAALAGQGFALVPKGLVLDELSSGRLINPHSFGYRSQLAYWYNIPSGTRPRSPLQSFSDWIEATLLEEPVE